jgi:TPP-dependent pyruvate/acetoin dehydrogenase alpha subunit
LASLHTAPVIFVIATTHIGEDAPVGPQTNVQLKTLANAYSIPFKSVDGRDAGVVQKAVTNARKTGGPFIIEAKR